MAIIGKIREKSGWVIGIIGLAMLGFIATDLLSNRLFRGNSGPKGIGRVYGQELDPDEFKDRLAIGMRALAQQKKGAEISVAEQNQTNDQTWNEFVDQKILEKEAKTLGLEVSGEEVSDMILGLYPDPNATQNLEDPKTHKVDKKQIKGFLDNFENAKPEQKEGWARLEDYLVRERLKNKYRTLVKAGAYATDLEMQDDYVSRNKTCSIQYVPLFLNTMPDSTVTITDGEVKDYYEKHKEDYKREDSRNFDYVTFDVKPSHDDSINTEKNVLALKNAFKNTKDDSSFVVNNGRGSFSKALT